MKNKITGVLHLDVFPQNYDMKIIHQISQKAIVDIESLQKGGIDQIIIENDFEGNSVYQEFLNKTQQKIFYEILKQLVGYIKVPFGFCVLLNDYKTALKLAKDFGGSFIRLDTFVDDVKRISDGIVIQPNPQAIMKYKKNIGAEKIKIFCDIHVKHAQLLDKNKTLLMSAKEAIEFGADGIIITGEWTGIPPKIETFIYLKNEIKNIILIVGSGVNSENIQDFKKYADGYIVGTSLKTYGYIDVEKVFSLKRLSKKYLKSYDFRYF